MPYRISNAQHDLAQGISNANGAFPASVPPATLAAITGEPSKSLTDVVTALGSVATAAQILAALEAVLKSGTTTAIAALLDLAGAGLPVVGRVAAGQDAYATVVTSPARVCRRLMISVETAAAVVSLDGGTTEHLSLAPGVHVLDRLAVSAGATIQAKNAAAGQNFANLSIAVW